MTRCEPFTRRVQEDPRLCGCPKGYTSCLTLADGEDRLCAVCREYHRPDQPRPTFGYEED